jgi:hypothetical protein
MQIINIISYTSLAIWDIPTGWKWTCFIIAGAGYGLSGLLMAYVPSPLHCVYLQAEKTIDGHTRYAPRITRNARWW